MSRLSEQTKNMHGLQIESLPVTSAGPPVSSPERSLVVFDFDETFVDADTYRTVAAMTPDPSPLHHVQEILAAGTGWPEYMQEIFKLLHLNGITPPQIAAQLTNLPLTQGMPEVMAYLRENRHRYDTIVISDANSCFIHWILAYHDYVNIFKYVFTNPSGVNERGCMEVDYYHNQDWCRMCPKHMCKGHILQRFLDSCREGPGTGYFTVYYIGDGENDFCPSKRLETQDHVFARRGFALANQICQTEQPLKCHVCLWSNGHEILQKLKQVVKTDVWQEVTHSQPGAVIANVWTHAKLNPHRCRILTLTDAEY